MKKFTLTALQEDYLDRWFGFEKPRAMKMGTLAYALYGYIVGGGGYLIGSMAELGKSHDE